MSGLSSPSKGSLLQNLHLYRKVPRDLTDATRLGGALSLACAAIISYLFVSNLNSFLLVQTETDVALDTSGDTYMRVTFNITMERLPCQFASVDLYDVMGTSLPNVTAQITKFKVAPDQGHRQEYFVTAPAIEHEALPEEEAGALMAMPDALPQLSDHDFERTVHAHQLVLVAFGAPWCPWSQRLEPVWRKTYEELKAKPYGERVRLAKVDCTAPSSQPLCQKQHIHAFPTIRIYRQALVHAHENYLGDRTVEAFSSFIEEFVSQHQHEAHNRAEPSQGAGRKLVGGQAVEAHTLDGEGCQIHGALAISRVPGNLRISAASADHSFNLGVMNVSHHVDKLIFSTPHEGRRSQKRLRNLLPTAQRSMLLGASYTMHQEVATLKHYLKVVPHRYDFLYGESAQTYLYKANYNEYRPRKLEWYEGKADAYVDTQLVPNAAFYYDISPVMVVISQKVESFSSFITKICAVIGGVYTVVGLLDGVVYHTSKSMSGKNR